MSEHCGKVLWESEEGKPVEVDQRALIHKVLARYPGEFTLFRELLQNFDDAQSSAVEIHFETITARKPDGDPPTPSNMKSTDIVQWTFKNNGKLFTREDWTRLAKIAKGNPDPRKVGAFGVGFYSLFSVTDRPVVTSGGHRMEFYWKDEDQLYVRQGSLLSEGTPSPWTIFQIPLREPGPMPEAIDLLRFLATSITFMVRLQSVAVFLNEHRIGCIEKFPGHSEVVDLPIAFERSGPLKMMVVDRLKRHRFAIQATTSIELCESPPAEESESYEQCDLSPISRSLPQLDIISSQLRIGDPAHLHTAKLDLTVFSAEVNVNVNEKFSKELIRCTAKTPPPRLTYNLVYTGKDEYDRSLMDQEHYSIFQGLRADLNGALHPRIFIGHSTSQTTGIGGHMESYFIPTVERESIDLVDRNIANWNRELLYIGGFLSRTVYELELSDIQTSWEEGNDCNDAADFRPPREFQDRLRERFIHVLKFFTFYHSTPSPNVAQLLQHSFYTCSASPVRLLSSVGVRYASDIRLFDSLCDRFLKHVPMLSPKVTEVTERTVNALPEKHNIRTITLLDVLQDLQRHVLDEGGLVACLQWQISHCSSADMAELSQVARFSRADGTNIILSSIQYFIDPSRLGAHIPSDGPLPLSVMPLDITKHLSPAHLMRFGWREFKITDWLQYISQPDIRSAKPEYDFVQSAAWAERVLRSVSSAWSSSDEIRQLAKSVFTNEKCIPTMHGLSRPEDSYLPSLDIPAFDYLCLPVVQLPSSHGINPDMQRLLISLGVQQHLPPQLLLTKMIGTGKWKTSDLITYLVQVADTLSTEDISELQSSGAFAKEGILEDTDEIRFRADELYPPIDSFRQLRLPLIEWEEISVWQDTTPEARLLYRLGLRRFPPLGVVMNLCSQDNMVGTSAFDYLCTNLRSIYSDYNPDDFGGVAFVPAENKDGACLEKLGDVFLENKWKILGFSVVRHRHQDSVLEELGVQRHPPSSSLLRVLKNEPPSNEGIARQWFEILSNHVSSFTQAELESLSQLPIVPKAISGDRKWLTPLQCYLGKSTKHDLYSKLFHFVNFGAGAMQFLRACGAKDEPSEENVAVSLIEDHERFYTLAGHERFLQELRDLAARHTRISNDTMSKMRFKPVLLGTRHERIMGPDGRKNTYSLWEPREIVIVDDIHTYQLFGDSIIAAPRDMPPELEQFYLLLGCKHLTTIVWDDIKASGEGEDTTMGSEFRALILERLPLFLHHYSQPQPETSVARLTNADNITVKVWENLSVSKTLTIGDKKTTKERGVWATTKYEQGTVQVWLSRSAKRDIYELAVSLCRVLFGTVNLSQTLLLTTILSEELDVLKGRGYETDLVHQREKHLDDPGSTSTANARDAIASQTSTLPLSDSTRIQHPVAESDLDSMDTPAQPTTNHLSENGEAGYSSLIPASAVTKATDVRDAVIRVLSRFVLGPLASGTATVVLPPSPWTPQQVMPRSYIQSTVKKSIQACHSKQQTSLHHRNDADMMKFLNNGYCDVSGPVGNLRLLGQMENVNVYVRQGLPNVDTFMERMRDPLAHFARIIIPLAKIYDLRLDAIYIFYDDTAGCIAFNAQGILYVNLRYFEAWHYQDVKNGNPRQAQSSWFLTLGHELAHNVVARHDAEHAFWFSAICEAHVDALTQLLGPASG